MKRVRLPLFAVVTLLSLTACSSLLRSLKGGIITPTAKLQGAKLEHVSLEDATVAATFVVENPNLVGIDLARTEFNFLLDGKKVFNGSAPAGLSLPPQGRATLTVPVKVPWDAVPNLVQTFQSKSEAPYEVQGRVAVRTPIGDLGMPVGWKGVVPIPKLPTVTLGATRIDQLSFTGAKVIVTLDVKNPNAFRVPLDALLGNVKIAGQPVAQLGLGAVRPLEPGRTTPVELPIAINFATAGMAVSSAVASRTATLEVAGEAKVGGKSLPLALSTTLR